MARLLEYQFMGGAYEGRSAKQNAQQCVNFYPVLDKVGGMVKSLYPTPGLKEWVDVEFDHPTRNMYAFSGALYSVIGNKVYRFNSDISYTALSGIIDTSSGMVLMAHNDTQLMIVTPGSGSGYIVQGTTLTKITDSDFPNAKGLCYQDGYFIINTSTHAYTSSLNDGTSWDVLDRQTAGAGFPDPILSVMSDHRELVAWGTETAEHHYNAGGADWIFNRIPAGYMETGLGAAYAFAKSADSVIFLDDALNIRSKVGYNSRIVSTPQIAYQFNQFDTISDAFTFSYEIDGHAFNVFNFPTEDVTYVYDAITGLIHTRSSWPNDPDGRWRANCHAKFAGKDLVGDWQTGIIYELDDKTYQDGTHELKSVRIGTPLEAGGARITISKIEVIISAGVGTISGSGVAPLIMLQFSKDGGNTWGPEHHLTMGALGEYGTRAIGRQFGKARHWIPKLTISDPVNREILQFNIYGKMGSS